MNAMLESPALQFGALGLASGFGLALVRALFALLSQRQDMQRRLLDHHAERERVFAEQLIACVDRNSAALEKVEASLQRIHVELARREGRSLDSC